MKRGKETHKAAPSTIIPLKDRAEAKNSGFNSGYCFPLRLRILIAVALDDSLAGAFIIARETKHVTVPLSIPIFFERNTHAQKINMQE
jgi:uncharacterized protein (DUF2062 family)